MTALQSYTVHLHGASPVIGEDPGWSRVEIDDFSITIASPFEDGIRQAHITAPAAGRYDLETGKRLAFGVYDTTVFVDAGREIEQLTLIVSELKRFVGVLATDRSEASKPSCPTCGGAR